MGENRVSHLFEEFLHDSLKQRIIQRIEGSPVSLPDDRKVLIAEALRAHKAQREMESIRQLTDSNPAFVASGLRKVIEICDLFLAKRLFISDSLQQNGFVCREHHYISLSDTQCPFCGRGLMPVENVIDEIVEIARMHGISLMMIEHHQDLMSKYDGIAGVSYVPLGRQ
jgi:peptide subunit release factor 1 (eRF1)